MVLKEQDWAFQETICVKALINRLCKKMHAEPGFVSLYQFLNLWILCKLATEFLDFFS